jgi:outer membrane murein-binding lipoprotein Lpp
MQNLTQRKCFLFIYLLTINYFIKTMKKQNLKVALPCAASAARNIVQGVKHSALALCAVAAIGGAMLLTSCSDKNKNDDNGTNVLTLNVDVTHGIGYDFDSVKAEICLPNGNYVVLASVPYNKGKFTITLPEVPEKYLDVDDRSYLPTGITVSDSTVKTADITLRTYKGSTVSGKISYTNTNPWMEGMYRYSNKALTEYGRGTTESGIRVESDVSLQKGWNVVYLIKASNSSPEIETSTKPANVNFEWSVDEYIY